MLEVEGLVDEAAAAAGSDDFGPETWTEGLAALVASANTEAALTPVGELTLHTQIVRSLVNRAGVLAWHRAHPETRARPVHAPVFILGLPRTGTTLLSYLLDHDPANRSLLRGECFVATPPPSAADLRTSARVVEAQAEMDLLYQVLPEFKAIHYEEGAGPTECVTLLGQDFRSIHYETMAHLPSYGRWALECDMEPAYRWHRAVLQVLQVDAPGRWVLKSPCHNLSLDALVAIYPDARFVVPHRDPATAVASLCDLVRVLAGNGTDVERDDYIGVRWLELAGRMIDGMQAARAAYGDDRFFDIDFDDLRRDPLAATARLYDWLGWPLSAAAEAGFRGYLDRARPGRFGQHRYDLARYGLTAEEVRARVADYCVRFGYV